MSLKGSKTNELREAIAGARNGEKKAFDKLAKYAEDGTISTDAYNKLIEKYGIKKEEKKTDRLKKIKSTFCAIASVVILFASMGRALQDLVVHYGKGIAVIYFFLWLWAFFYAFSNRKE